MRLSKEFRFEASHVLPKHPGKCSRLHGHSWVLTVSVEGPVTKESGFVMDYADISAMVKPLIDRLDHRHLGAWCVYSSHRPGEQKTKYPDLTMLAEIWGVDGDQYFNEWQVPGLPLAFNPTSENLIWWIGGELKFGWSELKLNETCTSECILTRKEFDAGQDRQG